MMTGVDPAGFGHDALQKRVGAMGGAQARRVEAAQALRGWKWLEELRLRFDLAIEILGTDLDYIFDPLPDLHVSAGLRSALLGVGDAALGEAVTGVIRSGKARALVASDLRIRLFPLFSRSATPAMPLGVLAIGAAPVGRPRDAPAESSEQADRRLDFAGQWLVAAIEADLAASVRQVSEARDLERMAGSFDVVDALTELRSDRSIIALLMDAVALWYDADVYVYQQDLSGAFMLNASLPGANAERAVPQLLGHHIWGRGEVFSPQSHAELEELGWSAAIGHTLFLPISVDQSTEWLLAVAGAGDDPVVRQTLGAFGRVAGALLTDLQRQTIERLGRKLTPFLMFGETSFHTTALLALEAVAAEAGASSVQFSVFEADAGPARPALSLQWGGADTDVAPFIDADTTDLSPQAIAVGVGASSGVTAVLSLRRNAGAFAPIAHRLARSAASTIALWLSGSLVASRGLRAAESEVYGAELVERLRHQVDRFGHVRIGGAVAVVLPQPRATESESVDEAVNLLEHHVRPTDLIGVVGGAGAGVLLPDATRDVASAVVGRLLRAAREKLVGVRVGVAMFAASTESPESVLERALINARRGSVG